MIASPGFEQNLPLWLRGLLIGVAVLVVIYMVISYYRDENL
jgi:hypothetical protein